MLHSVVTNWQIDGRTTCFRFVVLTFFNTFFAICPFPVHCIPLGKCGRALRVCITNTRLIVFCFFAHTLIVGVSNTHTQTLFNNMSQSAVNIGRPILLPSTFFSTLCDSEVFVFALKYAICRETYGFAYFFVIHFCVILYTYPSYSMHDELVKSVCGMCGRSCRLLVMQYI